MFSFRYRVGSDDCHGPLNPPSSSYSFEKGFEEKEARGLLIVKAQFRSTTLSDFPFVTFGRKVDRSCHDNVKPSHIMQSK
ncbi:hypothetical protein NPIL_43111 [Nephila pilipes]|uniref:Uncharacterized protein n=1 Tax=Nephila pilipes TaxID=299642 RepID=A0A8X6QM32_NEPPI|nr:hypothetical protein NPIL_43111 [Nephila pilipes]